MLIQVAAAMVLLSVISMRAARACFCLITFCSACLLWVWEVLFLKQSVSMFEVSAYADQCFTVLTCFFHRKLSRELSSQPSWTQKGPMIGSKVHAL